MKLKFLSLALCGSFVFAAPPIEHLSGPMDMAPAPTENAIPPLSQQNLTLFGTTLEAIREYYVTPVTDNTIIENAAKGMLENLDPHSDYLDATDFAALKTMVDDQFSGLGVEITAANGAILVIAPIDDSPAQKAGVKSGDYIVKINGTAVEGLSITQAMNMMRGPKGETVTLTIIRKGEEKPLTIKVVRDNIILKDVKTKVYDGHYGYLRIASFGNDTGKHVSDGVKQLFKDTNNQLYGVVLDLRSNPGGVVEAATDTANVFLDVNKIGYGKPVVYTKGRVPQSQYRGYVTGHDQLNGIPMVVLIDAGTASAAEIVTGALQDYHRAVIMGVRSFGKGSVQTVFPLQDDKTAIKLTTALYYLPNGQTIQGLGITPDVVVNNYSIPSTVQPTDDDAIREGDIANHISGDGEVAISVTKKDSDMSKTTAEIVNKNSNDKSLLYTDYQLNAAINMLMGLHATELIGTQTSGS